METYVIYGIGSHFIRFGYSYLSLIKKTVAFCDRDPEKQCERFLGRPVISPEKLCEYGFDKILIASPGYNDEIKDLLVKNYSVSADIIFAIDELAEEEAEILKNLDEYKLSVVNRQIEQAGQLSPEILKNCNVLANRAQALELMPKNAVTCEVGVAYGDFSEKILRVMQPSKFFAIDYFRQDDPYRDLWGFDYFKRDNLPHQLWYERKFRREIDSGQMEVRQGFSWDCLGEFPDDFFDYAYLDADHSYESVKKDIAVLKRKVKDGGYIQFNDYTHYAPPENVFYGVVPAVNEFLNEKGSRHEVMYLCLQENGYHDLVVRVCKG